jgi:hypothetical protein
MTTQTLKSKKRNCQKRGSKSSHKKRVEKLHYMHLNPVKRGLVLHPQDGPWSSFAFYSKRQPGWVPIDPVQ